MSHAMHGSGLNLADGKSAVLIAGPTASGKSALALAVAERHGGTIVNADSMQVYRDLRIITARPSAGGRGARAAPALRPCRCRRELFGRALVPGCRARRSTRRRRDGRAADPGRRHRALLQGADPGAFGGAADAARDPRRGAGALRRRGRRGAACRARPPRSGDGRAAQARRPDADRARAGGAGGDRALAGRLAPRRHAGDARSGPGAEGFSRRRPRRAARAGSTRASTPCWRPARWTR